jgi:prepilin-type N-terminal cleavage/methylation domain-containing protein
MRKPQPGFTLTELAVVLAIVGLLMASAMYTLSAQVEQRNFEETRLRLAQARELLLAFAVVNGRLPCPARSDSAGVEVRNAAGECKNAAATEDHYGGTLPGGVIGGLLPAVTIGHPQVDASGFALDAYQGRIRYVVAKTITGCSGTSTLPHFVHATNLKANGITCQPSDLIICKSSTGITATACGGAANQIMSQNLVVAIVFATGKNGTTTGGTGADEMANVNSLGIDPVFVYHTPMPADVANGEFDDQFTWITAGELYSKLIAAGVLP